MWKALGEGKQIALENSLCNGQCFGWRKSKNGGFVGVVGRWGVHLANRQNQVSFRVITKVDPIENVETEQALREYFQLETDLCKLYETWSSACPRTAQIAKCIPGMRILRQDPWECLLSFICSSNNNISRITLMLSKLREKYGKPLDIEADDMKKEFGDQIFQFPSVEDLSKVSEKELRDLGFGYRAKYITKTVEKMRTSDFGGVQFLHELRKLDQSTESLEKVRNALVSLDGVGPKVADCVALFSLDRCSLIPVDTHVWQIACRDFDQSLLESKSLTPAVYSRVGDLFRNRYGTHAGWAHSLLFAAELPLFQALLPAQLVAEMSAFSREEKKRKQDAKKEKVQSKDSKKEEPEDEALLVTKGKATKRASKPLERKGTNKDTKSRKKLKVAPGIDDEEKKLKVLPSRSARKQGSSTIPKGKTERSKLGKRSSKTSKM